MIIERLSDEMINDLKTLEAVLKSCSSTPHCTMCCKVVLEPRDGQLRIKEAILTGKSSPKANLQQKNF